MAFATTPPACSPPAETIADLLAQLGRISPQRLRLAPPPGTATEQDMLDMEARTGRLCELIDGVLVEKVMGAYESAVAAALIFFLKHYLRQHRLGIVLGADGMIRLSPQQVRIPDVAFVSRQRLGTRDIRQYPVLPVIPDLAVEVLSAGNTAEEMDRKLQEYFTADVRLVWYIDAGSRTARTYTGVAQCHTIGETGVLDGGDVLPGFALPLLQLFAEAEGQTLS